MLTVCKVEQCCSLTVWKESVLHFSEQSFYTGGFVLRRQFVDKIELLKVLKQNFSNFRRDQTKGVPCAFSIILSALCWAAKLPFIRYIPRTRYSVNEIVKWFIYDDL